MAAGKSQISKAKCPGAGRREIMIKDDGGAVAEEDKCRASRERSLISPEKQAGSLPESTGKEGTGSRSTGRLGPTMSL